MYDFLQKPGFYITHLYRGFPGSWWYTFSMNNYVVVGCFGEMKTKR
jgi:hypothetical protein